MTARQSVKKSWKPLNSAWQNVGIKARGIRKQETDQTVYPYLWFNEICKEAKKSFKHKTASKNLKAYKQAMKIQKCKFVKETQEALLVMGKNPTVFWGELEVITQPQENELSLAG